MATPPTATARIVLVGGHESSNGRDLAFLSEGLPEAIVTPAGRPLNNVVTHALAGGDGPIAVIPMSFGRNPTSVADTAKTLKWLSGTASHRLVLAEQFGTIDHLTAWLRTAATAIRKRSPEAGVIIAADAANPFDDAELYRIAHLVRTHGAGNEVEVAILENEGDLAAAVERMRRLGSAHSVIVPAGFCRTRPWLSGEGPLDGADFYGPLLSDQAIVRVIRDRAHDALHRLSHGDNGIDTGLAADHGHGYAHSHAFEEANGDHHLHPHSHGSRTHAH